MTPGTRIGLIADLHGNRAALEAVLESGEKQGITQWYCLGDFVDPLPDSAWTYRELKRRAIPMVRGNHEDYMVWARWLEAGRPSGWPQANTAITQTVRYASVFHVAKEFAQEELFELARLPLCRTVGKVLLCHASPEINMRGYVFDFDADIEEALSRRPEPVVVCGHWHTPWSDDHGRRMNGKRLYSIGSVGIAFTDGPGRAQYGVLEQSHGDHPIVLQMEISYDHAKTLERYESSGYLANGGPMAWALYLEIATGQRVLRVLRNHCVEDLQLTDQQEKEWWQACREKLESMGLWARLPLSVRKPV